MTNVYMFCDNRPMDTMGDRLRKAREDAGFRSARAAATHHHWTVSTYSAHENGQNSFDDEAAKVYGRAFRRSAGWLLTGEGPADRPNIVGVKGLVGAGGAVDTGPEQLPPDGNLYEIEVPFPLPEGAFALEVFGESMFPRYDSGDVIVCLKHSDQPEQLVGWEAAVQTLDGTRYLKRLLRGSRKGLYDLESFNASPMRGIKLQWASAVHGVVRSGQWRRLDPKGRERVLRQRSARVATILTAAVLLASAALFPVGARAQSLQLQETCARQAHKTFLDDRPDQWGVLKRISHDYQSHYNRKLNKCLVLIESSHFSNNSGVSNSAYLLDAYELRYFASYFKSATEVSPMTCELTPSSLQKKLCSSRAEFDQFVSGYME